MPMALIPAPSWTRVVTDRHLLSRLGLGTIPLYVTEFGWTTSPPGARDYLLGQLRPGYLAATLTGLARAGCGLAAVIAYTWVTERQDPGRSQQWYGIDSPSGAIRAGCGSLWLRPAGRAGVQPLAGTMHGLVIGGLGRR